MKILLLTLIILNACTISREGIAIGDDANKRLNQRVILRHNLENLSTKDKQQLQKLLDEDLNY